MKMDTKSKWPIAALSLIGMASSLSAARNNERCEPSPPVTCYQDNCNHCYCLGPDNYGANAPVCPKTCNGDLTIEVAGFYWNTHQDGMEYAIENNVVVTGPTATEIQALNNLVNAHYKNPDFDWDWGFKLGLGYCTTCDGWDIGVTWTWFKGHASSHDEAESDDNRTLITLWSAYASPELATITHASDIETNWKLELNLVDIELGRQYWVSKYLTMRPHVGIRISWLYQDYKIQNKGGSWTFDTSTNALTNEVRLDNDFRGAGLRGGLDTVWHLGCGWGIYGDFAMSIVYGRFTVDHDETNRQATGQHLKTKVLDARNSFRASRAMTDLALGIQWSGMFCECSYGLTVQLGWEQHIFFDQNQMWRVVRIGDTTSVLPNNTGENVFHERRGNLDTQGVTLTVKFDF